MTKLSLSDEDRKEVVRYRLEKAERAYAEAVGSVGSGFVETSANRLYYAAYYAVSALLIANGMQAKTHNGIIQLFGLHFIRTKVLDRRMGIVYNQLFSLRLTGDYEDRHRLSLSEDVVPLVKPARELIDAVSTLARKQCGL